MYERALTLLAGREYSVQRLRRKLLEKGEPEEVERVLQRLVEAGLLDDRRYAAAYVRSKLVGGGASVRRVKQELAHRGVASEVVAEAVGRVLEDEVVDTRASLERVARKKWGTMVGLDPLVARRRLYGFLARKGYELDEIQAVVQELMAGDR